MRSPCLILVALLGTSILAEASPKRVDLSTRNSLAAERTDVSVRNPRPEMSNQFGGSPMEIQQWHGNYSTLGRQRSSVANERSDMNRKTVEMNTVERKNISLPNSTQNRRRADIKNLDRLQERNSADRFAKSELRSPEARRMQEMVDEISLRELNRFQSQRNKTDDGIPSTQAGGESTLQVHSKSLGRNRS